MRLADVASMWQSSGVSVVPIVAKNQPAVRWKQYQARCPSLDELHEWWGNGHPYGLAIICGTVSGNLEMTELEARALVGTALTDIANSADLLGCGDVWDRINNGYTQASPSGGLHMVYRISDHGVPGNEKIAHNDEGLVLAETRGEGGYFVGAPSPGTCHPSGEPWLLASGEYGTVPTITWDERQAIHAAIKAALDIPCLDSPRHTDIATLSAVAPARQVSPDAAHGATSMSPADHWAMETDWADILEPQGWTLDRAQSRGGERFWVRPGKSVKDGHSASTDYQGNPGFYIWSTSAGFETETPLTKMYVQAHYTHRGDMSAFSKDCLRKGFGDAARPSLTLGELDLASNNEVPEAEPVPARYSHDDAGNGMRLWQKVRDKYRHVYEEKELYLYDGIRWGKEYTGALVREWLQCTEEMAKQGREERGEALNKWAKRSRSQAATNAAISMMKSMDGATISATDMNLAPDHINLNNGTYNVKTQVLEPHDRSQLMTRSMKANYEPEATCPKFEAFMEQVLPDPEVRQYVQRAVGYSILGRADRRAFFLIYGPSGTGKSQFLSTMEHVFGDYAATAAEGTFRTKESGGPNNDLHGLRGRRFVSTSETAENATFNENLLKRLSGRDKVVSRDLYQSNIEWTPECALWLATNHPPRFNSDDDAIWKRAKLVPFLTRFGTDVPEIPDYAREHLYAEADGILNWVLAGLQDFLANGLQEPDAVVSAAADHRSQSDSVVRFLEDQLADGILAESEDGSIRTRELFAMYEAWSRTSGERGLGSRRFINRLESSGRAKYAQTASHSVWKGIYSTRAIGWIGQGVIPGEMDKS